MSHRITTRAAALTAGAALAAGAYVSGVLIATSPADAATVPSCTGSQLVLSHSQTEGAAGSSGFVLEFRNRSDRACTLYGYPGLSALNTHDKVLANATRTKVGSVRTIDVRPGHYASATATWAEMGNDGKQCRTAPKFAFTAAGTSKTEIRKGSVTVCNLRVYPTVYGRSHA